MMGSRLASKANPLRDVGDWLDPEFAAWDISLRELLRRNGNSEQATYANTARLFVTVERPFWLDDGLPPSFVTDGPLGMFWAIDNHRGAGAYRAVIVNGGPRDRADLRRFLVAELARLRPASKGRIRVDAYQDWGTDPFQAGCGFSLAPGQVNAFARKMNEPWQVMHFAGEPTRRVDFGMEAAMESGERAPVEVMGRAG